MASIHTYNTDNFNDDFKKEIISNWKKDPTLLIALKGPNQTQKEFTTWIKETFPEALKNDENQYYLKEE